MGTYQDFILSKLSDLSLLTICCLNAKQSPKKEVVDFKLSVNVGQMSPETQNEADETIRTTESRVHTGTDTCHMLGKVCMMDPRCVNLPINPPGTANFRSLCSANRETTLEKIGLH